MTTFRLRRIIGTAPDFICDDDIVFRASRPIFGIEHDFGMMGFTTVVSPEIYGRDGFIQRNFELDAEVVEWVDTYTAVEMVRDDLRANGYPDEDIDGVDTSDLLESFPHGFGIGTKEI